MPSLSIKHSPHSEIPNKTAKMLPGLSPGPAWPAGREGQPRCRVTEPSAAAGPYVRVVSACKQAPT